MQPPKLVYILPSFQAFEYSRACLRSLYRVSPWVKAIVVDDGSPHWNTGQKQLLGVGGSPTVYRFPRNGGLTRSWNTGARLAREHKPDYIVFGNADVLFAADWWRAMVAALNNGWSLVGPLSNAPGTTDMKRRQHVHEYVPGYQRSDAPGDLDTLTAGLRAAHGSRVVEAPVNGFFMMVKAADVWKNGYSADLFFPPMITVMPSGRPNPTPRMTGQEDWLTHHWRKSGRKIGVALGSFIFHYRSASRGERFAKGDWCRIAG